MVKVKVNGCIVSIEKGSTVLQACKKAGVIIPRFCFHEKLLVAGNCRMCLVEIQKIPKPVASCAIPVMPDIIVFTETPLVKKAREAVLEFLLLNHPLDCPICDQGGECDLQEFSKFYGSDRSRFFMVKKSTLKKQFGFFIYSMMTRCILCTRCVRFFSEIEGKGMIGVIGRGEFSEISIFDEKKKFNSYLSGNVVDLCPVGKRSKKIYIIK